MSVLTTVLLTCMSDSCLHCSGITTDLLSCISAGITAGITAGLTAATGPSGISITTPLNIEF